MLAAIDSSGGASALFRWTSGGAAVSGETFTGDNTRTYFNSSGVLLTAGTNVKRDPSYTIAGVFQGLLLEAAATNIVLWNRDCSNAAWTKSSMTAALDQTGIDGTASSASSLLATGANATCLQAITLASSVRMQSAFVKRLVGSGTINMTTDGGTTWTVITVTASWTRVTVPLQTVTNPSVGFRIVTSGDKIAVDYVQNETRAGSTVFSQTSPILTTTVAVTRAAEVYTIPASILPGNLSFYGKVVNLGTIGMDAQFADIFRYGRSDGTGALYKVNARNTAALGLQINYHNSGGSDSNALGGPVASYADTLEILGTMDTTGTAKGAASLNGAAAVAASDGGAITPDATFGAGSLVIFNGNASISQGAIAMQSFKAVSGVKTLDQMRAA